MTNTEASKILTQRKWCGECCMDCSCKECDMAFDMAIKALEQEPCEDVISRQSAIFLASDLKQDLPDDGRIADMVMAHNEGILEYQTQLSLLPPITPQPKTDMLNKIRAEIEARLCDVVSDYTDGYRTAIQGALAILDKYKAESVKE